MLKRRGFWLVAVIVVLVVAGIVVMKKKSAAALAASATAAAAATSQVIEFLPGDVVTVNAGEIRKVLVLSGALRAYNQAVVKAKLAGDVSEVLVREGEAVQLGQVLVKMNTADFESRLLQARGSVAAAQGQLDIARQTRDNNKALLDKNFISKNAFDNGNNQYLIAAANLDSAKAALAVSQKALADTVIRAPMTGFISSRSVQPGEKISPDNKLFDVVDLRTLEMEAPVPTQDIASIHIGQQVQIQIEGITDAGANAVVGKVGRINPATTAGSRSIMAYIQIANPAAQAPAPAPVPVLAPVLAPVSAAVSGQTQANAQLRAGMFAEARLVVAQKNAVLSIPQTALRYEDGKGFVYVITGKLLQKKFINPGMQGDSNVYANSSGPGSNTVVEVLSGVARGDQVVITNLGNLRVGMPVKLAQPAAKG